MNLETFLKIVTPYTMTSVERITSLYDSLEYIRKNNISGDIVECGVWKGGNILGAIEYMKFHKMDRNVWLYDTFSGMTESKDLDVDIYGVRGSDWVGKCDCSLEEVKNVIEKTNYKKIKYVVGDIVETLNDKNNIPNEISILRLDTDWYQSTKKEMEVLYPLLIEGGVLIVDDYGHWKGSKKAIDEYFNTNEIKITNIDYTGIKIIK